MQVPTRVGRLSQVQGTVSWHGPEAERWDAAAVNLPVAVGDAFWTEPAARAQIEIGADALAMNGATELDINQLDEHAFVATEPQGETLIYLAALAQNETWTVQTPRGLITLKSAGCYDIQAGDTEHPTQVSVLDGSAEISGTNVGLQVGKNQTAVIQGADSFTGSVDGLQTDDFVQQNQSMCQPPQPSGTAPPAAVMAMTGGADLAAYGAWTDVPQYGQVWYPQVDSSWVPYRLGYWGYVGDWGWTWIDNEPWGFAPFHYGRWAYINDRWGWVPGTYEAGWLPVFAPALVTFFATGGVVGWAPLGPHEPFYPWWRAQPDYVRFVNRSYVTNVTEVVNRYESRTFARDVRLDALADRRALTAIPAEAFAASRPVAALARPVAPDRLAALHPVFERAALRPAVGAFGLTAREADRLHVPGGPTAVAAAHAAAPGPEIRAVERRAVAPVALRAPVAARPGAPIAGIGRPARLAAPEHAVPEHGPVVPPLARPGERPAATPVPETGALRPPEAGRPGPAPEAVARPAPEAVARPAPEAVARPGPVPRVERPAQEALHAPIAPVPTPRAPVAAAVPHPEIHVPAPRPAPAPVVHPVAPAFHPPAPEFHPPPAAFHPPPAPRPPPPPAFHPPPAAFHPPPAPRPPPPPHPAPPGKEKEPRP